MNVQKQSFRQGFTLIEILVGTVLTGVISLGVVSIMMLLFTSSTRVKQQDAIEQTKYNLQGELSNSIRWATSVTVLPSGSGFSAEQADGTTVTYELQNNQLLKDSVVITPEDVEITTMSVTNKSLNSNLVSLAIDLSVRQKSFTTVQDTARIVVSQRKTTISSK